MKFESTRTEYDKKVAYAGESLNRNIKKRSRKIVGGKKIDKRE